MTFSDQQYHPNVVLKRLCTHLSWRSQVDNDDSKLKQHHHTCYSNYSIACYFLMARELWQYNEINNENIKNALGVLACTEIKHLKVKTWNSTHRKWYKFQYQFSFQF